jgi:hypothetical protein
VAVHHSAVRLEAEAASPVDVVNRRCALCHSSVSFASFRMLPFGSAAGVLEVPCSCGLYHIPIHDVRTWNLLLDYRLSTSDRDSANAQLVNVTSGRGRNLRPYATVSPLRSPPGRELPSQTVGSAFAQASPAPHMAPCGIWRVVRSQTSLRTYATSRQTLA